MPLTGIPLPFLSYGGSALLAMLAAIGILLSVSRYGVDGRTLATKPKPVDGSDTIVQPKRSRRRGRNERVTGWPKRKGAR
jgi:hypothetical protein